MEIAERSERAKVAPSIGGVQSGSLSTAGARLARSSFAATSYGKNRAFPVTVSRSIERPDSNVGGVTASEAIVARIIIGCGGPLRARRN